MLSGCIGTFGTRTNNWGQGKKPIGSYPFKAVSEDLRMTYVLTDSDSGNDYSGIHIIGPIALMFSLPLDLAIDIVLTPLDLIAWPFGWKKSKLE